MFRQGLISRGLPAILLALFALPAGAQSFRVQCPTSTITHPGASQQRGAGLHRDRPTLTPGSNGYQVPTRERERRHQVPADLRRRRLRHHGRRHADVHVLVRAAVRAGRHRQWPARNGVPEHVQSVAPSRGPAIPATTDGDRRQHLAGFVSLAPADCTVPRTTAPSGSPATSRNLVTIFDISEVGNTVTVVGNAPLGVSVGDRVTIAGSGHRRLQRHLHGHRHQRPQPFLPGQLRFHVHRSDHRPGRGERLARRHRLLCPENRRSRGSAADHGRGRHEREHPGAADGDRRGRRVLPDLTNVGMIMRPDLFEQHTVHFHGYPNASSFYDGVPDASVAINIGGSFTYYYLAPDAGTYFWHCHITPPEHLQMGMVGPDLRAAAAEPRAGQHDPVRCARRRSRRSADGLQPPATRQHCRHRRPTSCAATRCRP